MSRLPTEILPEQELLADFTISRLADGAVSIGGRPSISAELSQNGCLQKSSIPDCDRALGS